MTIEEDIRDVLDTLPSYKAGDPKVAVVYRLCILRLAKEIDDLRMELGHATR